jgi:hypothetical protein
MNSLSPQKLTLWPSIAIPDDLVQARNLEEGKPKKTEAITKKKSNKRHSKEIKKPRQLWVLKRKIREKRRVVMMTAALQLCEHLSI